MYVVIDEMCGVSERFEDLKMAKRVALNIQGVVIDEETKEVLADYTYL